MTQQCVFLTHRAAGWFWGPCRAVCFGDLDGDGVVGINDFLELLANWGECPSPPNVLDMDYVDGVLVRIWSDGSSEYKSTAGPTAWTEIPANPDEPKSTHVALSPKDGNNRVYRAWADGSIDICDFVNNSDGNGWLTTGWH